MHQLSNLLKENVPHSLQRYFPNDVIILQGEDSSKILVCNEGWLNASVYSIEGRNSIVAFGGPGYIFGLLTLFQSVSNPVSVLALSKATVLVFEKDEIERFLTLNPKYMAKVVGVLGQEVSNLKDIGIAAGCKEAIEKIYNLLVHLAMTHGGEDELGWNVPFKLTQQHISEMMGLSRVRISECLKTLEGQGKIQINKKEYKVLKKKLRVI